MEFGSIRFNWTNSRILADVCWSAQACNFRETPSVSDGTYIHTVFDRQLPNC